jgi:hypothetical protein
LVIGWAGSPCEVLGTDLLHVELACALLHRLEYLRERWRVALDPPQWINTGHDKGTQIRTD